MVKQELQEGCTLVKQELQVVPVRQEIRVLRRWRIQGRGPAPPLFGEQTEVQRAG